MAPVFSYWLACRELEGKGASKQVRARAWVAYDAVFSGEITPNFYAKMNR